MKNLRIYFSEQGWIVDTPFGLTQVELGNAIAYHKKAQTDRIKSMTGEKKENCQKALDYLTVATIRQNVLPNEYNEIILQGAR